MCCQTAHTKNTLYIPFWIYSNKIEDIYTNTSELLYIPFWIYSNSHSRRDFIRPDNFTFHSGYIPIYSGRWYRVSAKHFTFHSGYIPMVWSESIRKWFISALHSILDIFQCCLSAIEELFWIALHSILDIFQ